MVGPTAVLGPASDLSGVAVHGGAIPGPARGVTVAGLDATSRQKAHSGKDQQFHIGFFRVRGAALRGVHTRPIAGDGRLIAGFFRSITRQIKGRPGAFAEAHPRFYYQHQNGRDCICPATQITGTGSLAGSIQKVLYGTRAGGAGAGRNPRLLFRLPGSFPLRLAARQLTASLFQLPPRFTRLTPWPAPTFDPSRCAPPW